MAYVLSDGASSVVTYPYSVGLLRRDNANVSFPANPSIEQLAEWNVFSVVEMPQPSYNVISENLSEIDPEYVEGKWKQRWQVTAASAEEIAERTAAYEQSANDQAAAKLAETEKYWTLAFETGKGLSPEFVAYRDALKNPSSLTGYPVNPIWPSAPAEFFDVAKELPIDVYTTAQADTEFATKVEVATYVDNFSTAISQKADISYVDTSVSSIDLSAYYTSAQTNTAIDQAIADLIGTAPETLDTLGEISTALQNNEDAVSSIVTTLGTKANASDVYTKVETDSAIAAAVGDGGTYLPLAGGTMSGELDMGFQKIVGLADPEWPQDAVNKQFLETTISGFAATPKLTINLETSTGNITTSPVIANALTTIGSLNGYTINLGFGEYRETGPIVFDNKWQLQVCGPRSAMTTAATIKNGVTVQNSNGVRFQNVQIEGVTSIASRAGLGMYADRTQFLGNVTLSGTGGFMMFTDCDFGANVTIDPAYAGTIYFVRCNFSNASGVYTFSQASALQAIISDSSGIPNASIAKASFSGNIIYKNGSQALFLNGTAISNAGATNGQVLKYNSAVAAFVPSADNATDATKVPLAGGTMTGALTLSGAPTSSLHAATKAYVDSADALKANSADVYTKTQVDTSLAAKANTADVYTKAQVDSADAAKVNKSGDTMTGALTLSGAPTSSLHAATKAYVDTAVSGVVNAAPAALDTLNELAAALGNDSNFATTVSTQIGLKANSADVYTKTQVDTSLAAKANSADVYTKAQVDSADAAKVNKSGDTMTGALTLSGDPAANLHAATKQYVDTKFAAVPAGMSSSGASFTDNAVVRYDGTTGAVVQSSTVTLSDTGQLSGVSDFAMTGRGTTSLKSPANTTIDCSLGNVFSFNINMPGSAFAITNAPSSGTVQMLTVVVSIMAGLTPLPTWPASVIWPSGTAPTLTAGKTHVITLITTNGGTTWRGFAATDYTA